MRLPRDVSGEDLARRLARFGYVVTRQNGSHLRLSTAAPSQHHITIPNHPALRIGTLAAVVNAVADHLQMERDAFVTKLFK